MDGKDIIKVDTDTNELVNKIINENDVDELKKFTQLFIVLSRKQRL